MFYGFLKNRLAILAAMTLVSMTVIGCGSSGSSSSGGANPPAGGNPPAAGDISEQNRDQVVAAVGSALDLALESGGVYFSVDPSTSTIAMKSKAIAASETKECKEGGSYTLEFDTAGVGTYVYTDCREYGKVRNGTRTFTYDGNGDTETFTNYSEKSTDSWSDLEASYKSATLKTTRTNGIVTSMSLEADGYFKKDGIQVDVDGYQVAATYDGTNMTVSTSGRIKTTPCLDKWVEVETVTAMKMTVIDYSASCPTTGEVKILGGDNTSLTLNFNADGSADVSINGGSKEHYDNCDDLPDAENTCK